jgi:hypothetical protein
MDTKRFDLADWQRRLKLASGDELLALTEEILARDEGRTKLAEALPTQDKAGSHGPHDEGGW